MPYLNLDLNYFTHPKTRRLIGLLGRGSEMLPIRLWCHCGAHHCDTGVLADYSPQEIESIVEWWGKPGEMLAALLKVGFLRQTEGGFEIPGWREYQGHISAYKERGKMMAEARWKKARDAISNAASNARSDGRTNEKERGGSARATAARAEEPCRNGAIAPPPPPGFAATSQAEKARSAPPVGPRLAGADQPPEPLTNKPTLEQALAKFAGSDYRAAEVRATWQSFEAAKGKDGSWWWGKRLVGDWRWAMERRMADDRQAGGGKPPVSVGETLTRIAASAHAIPLPDLD